MGPVYHELSLLLFLPHPAPEWDLSTGSQVPPGKLLQHTLISPHIHRSCQGSLLCYVLGFFCSVSFVLVFFMILRRKWKLVGLDVFTKRNRLSSYRVQGLFACKESAALMCFLGLFIHSLSWNIQCGNGSRPGKWSQTLLVWPLSESSCLWEESGHSVFMVRGFGEHPVSFSRVVLLFSLFTEQERWKGEWKYFSEIHHMWFPLQESRVVIADVDRKSFCKRSDVTPSSVHFPEFLLKSQGTGEIFHIYPHHYI